MGKRNIIQTLGKRDDVFQKTFFYEIIDIND